MLSLTLLSIASLSLVYAADEADAYTQYPSVPHTASINGFADRIYDQVPSCAQECLKQSTSNTPCPYWDTGCLCVMPQFGGAVGNCVAENCQGSDVGSFESLATSICSSAGVWEPYWMIPGSVSSALASAATAEVEATTTDEATTTAEETTEAEETTTTAAEETTEAAETTTAAEETTEAAETTTAAEETTAEETTEAAETTTAAEESSAAKTTTAAEESTAAEETTEKAESSSAAAEESSAAAESSSVSVEVANAGHMQTAGGVIAAVAAIAAFF